MCDIMRKLTNEAKAEGREEGFEKGLVEGREEERNEIKYIKPYLKEYEDDSIISRITGWRISKIAEYRMLLL